MNLRPWPAQAAPRRPLLLTALLAVVAALSVDARSLAEQWLAPPPLDLPSRGSAQQAIDAASQWSAAAPLRRGKASRLKLERLQADTTDAGGSTVRFSAQTSGGVLPRYRWDFGDGTHTADWSVLHSAQHRYAEAGAYAVRVSVVDDRGQHLEQVLMHHVPGQASAPP
jgi:PKD domain